MKLSFSPHRRKGGPTTRKARPSRTTRLELERLEDRWAPSTSPSTAALTSAYGQLPLAFEANQGQAARGVNYLAHGSGYTLDLSAQQAVLNLDGKGTSPTTLTMQLDGSNESALAASSDKLITKSNYLSGPDSSKWITNIANYGQVSYQNVYPGIGVSYYGNQGHLEYDFTVNPGANPNAIQLQFQGQQGMALDGQGNLVLQTAVGPLLEQAPVAYQVNPDGSHTSVASHYVLEGNGQVGFAVGAYDPTKTLVIDPVLSYSTYLGGFASVGFAIAVDSSGDAYVTGANGGGAFVAKLNPTGTALVYQTNLGSAGGVGYGIAVDSAGDACVAGANASNFPTTPNAFSQTGKGFVSVLNPSGSGLIYSTLLPGVVGEGAFDQYNSGGIAVDSSGNAYVTGPAGPGLPTTSTAFQSTYAGSSGGSNAFLAKFNPTLSGTASLVYCTYLGGSGGDLGTGVAVDSSGNAYLTGQANSSNFPTTSGAFQTTYGGNGDAFVAKINPNLSGSASLVYSTYLGGSGTDGLDSVISFYSKSTGGGYLFTPTGPGIAVDSSGNAYVGGFTSSTNFPTTAGAYETSIGSGHGVGFVTKLNATGSQLVYSTYLGVNSTKSTFIDAITTEVTGIALDASGNAYVTGLTRSTSFPLVNPIQKRLQGSGTADAFVTTLNATGSALLFSTYLGGSGDDFGLGIAVDGTGSAYVTGITSSSDFPTTSGAYQTSFAGNWEGFVAKISPSSSGPAFPVLAAPTGSHPAAATGSLSGPSTPSRLPGSMAASDQVFANAANLGLLQAFDILLADQDNSLSQDPSTGSHHRG
jgi:hypothetical protein